MKTEEKKQQITASSAGEPEILISRFRKEDQDAVKQLILLGLEEHWGTINPELNLDLNHIHQHYKNAVFLVARLDDEIIGCGALIPRPSKMGEVMRMSVRKQNRRMGVGLRILDALCAAAADSGLSKIILETTASWSATRAFYEAYGFKYSHFVADEFGGQAHYVLKL